MVGQQPGLRRVLIEWPTVRTARIRYHPLPSSTADGDAPCSCHPNSKFSIESSV